MVWEYIKKNWVKILLLVIGAILGILGNIYVNKLSEDRIIAAINAKIDALMLKQKTGRINADEQKQLIALQAQLAFATGRIGICSDCSQTWQKENCSNCKA